MAEAKSSSSRSPSSPVRHGPKGRRKLASHKVAGHRPKKFRPGGTAEDLSSSGVPPEGDSISSAIQPPRGWRISGVAPRRGKSSRREIKLVRKAPLPLLQIDTLSIRRDGTHILREVDWSVRRGEHWVILGPNGSGKTSLLAALTGYFMPTSGDLMLLGEKFGESDWRKLREHIGIVSSSIRQRIPDYEPATEVVVGGKYAMIDFWGTPKPAEVRAARQLLAGLDCAYLAGREWGVLSQGERQRVLIARALMAKPELLILDEPCAGLDPVARERFLNWLDRLGRASSRPALVLVTHHVEEIMPAFSHVLMLKDGAVAATGPMKETLTSANLSKAFAIRIRLQRKLGRYTLVLPRAGF